MGEPLWRVEVLGRPSQRMKEEVAKRDAQNLWMSLELGMLAGNETEDGQEGKLP